MINIEDYPNAAKVFEFFEEITKIPHTSENTSKIADYLVDFAKKRNLWVVRDEANNVVIRKNATKGLEDRPTVIFQGHTDMVADQSPVSTINMLTDGLEIYRDGDYIKAKGTTLGADNGIAVAYALAVLDSSDIPHPEFEAVFTSDEEIGLIGANALDTACLHGKTMINIDSDAEGIFTAGCAGGLRIDLTLPFEKNECAGKAYKISLTGLKGGHSGVEINCGRENAIKILAEIMSEIKSAQIAEISGGNADNAIPRYAECIVAIDSQQDINDNSFNSILKKYASSEPDISIKVEAISSNFNCYSVIDTQKILEVITKMPTGVYKMSEDIPGLVETSSNLGLIGDAEGRVTLSLSVRSSKGSEKSALSAKIISIGENYCAKIFKHGEYPAWEYKSNSHLRNVLSKVYFEMYKKDARIEIIHAGLECGIFSNKIEGLDCVSLGPDMFDIHTTDERLSISSTARVWEFLKKVLGEI